MRPSEQLVRKPLRRLRKHDERAVEALDKAVAFDPLDGVARRYGRERRSRLHRGREHAADEGCRGKRTRGVVDENEVAIAQGSQTHPD